MTSTNGYRGLRGSVAVAALAAALAVCGQTPAAGQTAGDFDGDGRDDLAIGVPLEDIDGAENANAGAVNVLYGTNTGLKAKGDQFWHRNKPDVLGTADLDDLFGWALAAGDFDGDGFDDLAVGVPLDDIGGVFDAGSVTVLYGSLAGLAATGNQFWHQDNPGIGGVSGVDDRFGDALAAGDFDDDGFDDLAVGVPGKTFGSLEDAGWVSMIFGSVSGLTTTGHQIWHQDTTGIDGTAEFFDRFGSALVAGDFNNDGHDDLAVGAPGEDVGTLQSAGAVNVILGSDSGLTAVGSQLWHQDTPSVREVAESLDGFGRALAAGDFDNDGFDDLAIGVQLEDLGTIKNAGAVNLFYGSLAGLTAGRDQLWHQNKKGIKETAEKDDFFGSALAAGDFDRDGFDDLAVGVSSESVGTIEGAGAVNLLYGTAKGLKAKGNQLWHQNKKGVGEKAEANDLFGFSLTVGRFNKGQHRDLAIGVREESVGTVARAGAVNLLYGSAAGLTAQGDQVWHQNQKGVKSRAEAGEFFGHALP